MQIRVATQADVREMLAIYAHYVRESTVSFELEPPDESEFAHRLQGVLEQHVWLVCVEADHLLGYAYACPFRSRPAYQWTTELTVYVAPHAQGRGIGRGLYAALLRCVGAMGFATVLGVITLPNPASVGLHESLGFRKTGEFPRVGFKHGAWRDTGWWSLTLDTGPPRQLRTLRDLGTDELASVLSDHDP